MLTNLVNRSTRDTEAGIRRVWLVTQLLRGSTLEAMLDRADFTDEDQAPPLSWAAAITAQIAAVLAVEPAVAELGALRLLLARAFGEQSTPVRNLDKQVSRLRSSV